MRAPMLKPDDSGATHTIRLCVDDISFDLASTFLSHTCSQRHQVCVKASNVRLSAKMPSRTVSRSGWVHAPSTAISMSQRSSLVHDPTSIPELPVAKWKLDNMSDSNLPRCHIATRVNPCEGVYEPPLHVPSHWQ